MGIEVYRGIKAEEQQKTYSKNTNAKLGHLRAEIDRTDDLIRLKELSLEMASLKSEFDMKSGEFETRKEHHYAKNSGDTWQKGFKPFHGDEQDENDKKKAKKKKKRWYKM